MINPDYPIETGNFMEHTYQNQPQFNMNNGYYYPGVNPSMMNGGFADASARPVPPTLEEFNAMSMGQQVPQTNPMFNQFNNVPPYNGTQFSQPTMEQCGYQQPQYNPYQTNYGGMQMPYQNPVPTIPQMQQTQNPWAPCQQNPFDPAYNAAMYNQYNAAPTTKKTQQWEMSNVPIKPQMPTANWQQYIPNNCQQNTAPTYPSIPVPADIAQQSQSLLNIAKQNWG